MAWKNTGIDGIVWTGCISPDGYTYAKRRAVSKTPVVKGRPRYRLEDMRAAYDFAVTMHMTDSQFNAWQTFWYGATGAGELPFKMRLTMDDVFVFQTEGEIYEVTAITPWSSSIAGPNHWTVSLTVQSPSGFRFDGAKCDVIVSGPVDDLPPDSIYGGPIDNLATDIIAPCEEVFIIG